MPALHVSCAQGAFGRAELDARTLPTGFAVRSKKRGYSDYSYRDFCALTEWSMGCLFCRPQQGN
jgi:hypothetical protein